MEDNLMENIKIDYWEHIDGPNGEDYRLSIMAGGEVYTRNEYNDYELNIGAAETVYIDLFDNSADDDSDVFVLFAVELETAPVFDYTSHWEALRPASELFGRMCEILNDPDDDRNTGNTGKWVEELLKDRTDVKRVRIHECAGSQPLSSVADALNTKPTPGTEHKTMKKSKTTEPER
jgi:hypothetical protein